MKVYYILNDSTAGFYFTLSKKHTKLYKYLYNKQIVIIVHSM